MAFEDETLALTSTAAITSRTASPSLRGEQAFQALPVDLAGDIDWQRVDHNNVRGDEYPCHQLPAVRTQGFRIDLFAADSVQIERLVQDHNEQMQRFGYLPLDS